MNKHELESLLENSEVESIHSKKEGFLNKMINNISKQGKSLLLTTMIAAASITPQFANADIAMFVDDSSIADVMNMDISSETKQRILEKGESSFTVDPSDFLSFEEYEEANKNWKGKYMELGSEKVYDSRAELYNGKLTPEEREAQYKVEKLSENFHEKMMKEIVNHSFNVGASGALSDTQMEVVSDNGVISFYTFDSSGKKSVVSYLTEEDIPNGIGIIENGEFASQIENTFNNLDPGYQKSKIPENVDLENCFYDMCYIHPDDQANMGFGEFGSSNAEYDLEKSLDALYPEEENKTTKSRPKT